MLQWNEISDRMDDFSFITELTAMLIMIFWIDFKSD